MTGGRPATGDGPATEPGGGPATLPEGLRSALADLLRRRPVLLAFDFDGALAPIVDRPPDARALDGSVDLLGELAAADGAVVALVSGRSRADLAAVSGLDGAGPVLLVGSHGAESDEAGPAGLDDAARRRLAEVHADLAAVAARHPGAHVETKPASAVLHTRQVAAADAAAATREALAAATADRPGRYVTEGKSVVEVAVVETGKGAALDRLRSACHARGVLYVGDDVTDEDAFAVLRAGDVGVKVGPGRTLAGHRVADPAAVRELLRAVRDLAVP